MSYANVITGHIGHFLVRMSRLTFAEGLFCYLFVYMSHTDITAGHFRHLFIHISHLSYTKGYFCPFFFICPILFFWQTFCIEEL